MGVLGAALVDDEEQGTVELLNPLLRYCRVALAPGVSLKLGVVSY